MKKTLFDFVIILVIALVLTALNELDILGNLAGFLFIPILIVYFTGQFVAHKFPK
jgi:predicted membrane protein